MVVELLSIEFLYYIISFIIFIIIVKYMKDIKTYIALNRKQIFLFSCIFCYVESFIKNTNILEILFFMFFTYIFCITSLCLLFTILFFLLNLSINILFKITNIFFKKANNQKADNNLDIKTGIDYENYIAHLLTKNKFKVQTTSKTGDYGVDLIAQKSKTKIAIQCKYYSHHVGVRAVQEVISGMKFYDCKVGCVVSNNTFTKNAKILADSQNILLLNEKNICKVLSLQ